MRFYNYHFENLTDNLKPSLKPILNGIQWFWRFSDYYGGYIATPPDKREI